MSVTEILSAVKSGKLNVADADKLLAQNSPKGGSRRTIKANQSGGLFVRDESFKAFSAAKNKAYIASANIPREVAVELFKLDADGKPGELLREVCAFVATM